MDEIGPDATKRRRLGSFDASSSSYASQRPRGNGKPISDLSSHAFSNPTLPPPVYNQRPPRSPYGTDPPAEHRPFPDPQHHSFTHNQSSHSGYSTPLRDPRSMAPEPPYVRNHSVSGAIRSPVDNQPPTQLRPLNTTGANDVSHHIPQYHSESTRVSSSYAPYDGPPNGNMQHGLPLSSHHDQFPSNSQQGAYLNSPGNGPQPYTGPFGPGPVEINTYRTNQIQPRKSARATQACDTCRTRKARCDEGKPACSYCVENNQQCNYKEVAPAKHERAQREILDRLQAVEEAFRKDKADHNQAIITQNATLENQKVILENLIQILGRIEKNTGSRGLENTLTDGESKKSEDFDVKPFQAQRDADSRERKVPSRASSRGFSISSIAPQGTPPTVPEVPQLTFSTTTSEVSGDRLSDRDREHGTAAHKLLRWPSIKRILDRRNSFAFREGFVTETEERKGIIRPFGQGYGLRQIDEMGHSKPVNGSPATKLDDIGRPPNIASSAPWGIGGFGPRDQPRVDWKHTDHVGGLDTDGLLKMDPATVHRLVDSYLAHMHIMQPFLDRKQLRQMADDFIAQKPPSTSKAWPSAFSPQVSGQKYDASRDMPIAHGWHNSKRRYESPLASIRPDISSPVNQQIERSISNAVVLLVLALGKICEHKGPLPGPVKYQASRTNTSQASPSDYHDSPQSAPARTSSAASTPGSYSATSAQSPMNDTRSNHGISLYPRQHVERYNTAPVYTNSPSTQAAPSTPSGPYDHEYVQNVDKIPGLAYYAYATDILGNEHGGIEVQHVQARLLAGLYTGQLACVIESWQWIQSACVVCILLTRDPQLKRYQRLKNGAAIMDSIRFAYYTCVQLESDILAELDFPATPMEAKDGSIVEFPRGVSNESGGLITHSPTDDRKVLACYSAQIYIRRALNAIQRELYPPNHENLGTISPKTQKVCEEMLEGWRSLLPAEFQWKDEDEPSTDINEARLRAKYYGGVYIIHRPFLYHALHNTEYRKTTSQVPDSDRYGNSAEDSHRSNGSMAPPQNHIMRSAEKCVRAAMRSTIAFDRVCDDRNRLIVTNIFGTAHAQFGNILVLAATYCTPHLRHLVHKEELTHLIERTNRFLRMQKYISDTLDQDARILETVSQSVFGDEVLITSFSSD